MAVFTDAQYRSAFIHEVRESFADKYYVVVINGDLKVFDRATGAEHIVTFPDGKAYLTNTGGFKAVTVGDTTYLVNLDVVVKRSSERAPSPIFESLIYVRQADYGTTYTITINGTTISYTTTSTVGDGRVDTGTVAQALEILILANATLAAEFTINLFGSSIYLTRVDGAAFTVVTTDGVSDKGLQVIKGSVQTFAELPTKAPNGMILAVTGDQSSTLDNYWVSYDTPSETWVECAAPGTPVGLDASTMPWLIGRGTESALDLVASKVTAPTVSRNTTTEFVGGPAVNTGLQTQAATLDTTVGGTPAGATRTVTATFDIYTIPMDAGVGFTASLYINNGTGFVLRASRDYTSGQWRKNETLSFTGALNTGAVVRIGTTYGTGATPTSSAKYGTLTAYAGVAVSTTYASSVTITFNPTDVYPVGSTVTITANSVVFTHTTVGADETGLTVANAFAAAMTPTFTVVNSLAGWFTISSGGGPITWSATATATLPATVFFSPTISLTTDQFIGRTLVDDTDGSRGVVTGNSVHSITVSSLTGGTANAIKNADNCHIEISALSGFVFTKGPWEKRKAGDLKTCPLPSFVDHTIDECFFYQNRLGFTARENTVLSESGVSANFMRKTATQLLASDPIDFKSSHPGSGVMEHAVEYDGSLFLFTAAGHQYALTGRPTLTPQSFALEKKSSFPVSPTVRPIALGKALYFPRNKSTFSQIMRYFLTVNGKADAVDVTETVPQYLTGTTKQIFGDPALEMLFARTSTAPDTLWVQSFHYEGDSDGEQLVMSSWSKWVFPNAEIIYASSLDGLLSMLVIRPDGVCLETIDLGVMPAGDADHRDRQGFSTPVDYTSKYQFSTLFIRDKDGDAETRGRLQLRFGILNYADTTGFKVTVTPQGRTPIDYVFPVATGLVLTGGYFSKHYFDPRFFSKHYFAMGTLTGGTPTVGPSEGDFTFPIETRNLYAIIEINSTGAKGFAFNGFDWEGNYTARARRI